MLIGSTVLPKITDSFSSLVFFYDPSQKKVLFSNIPLQHFFGSPVNMEDDLPFSILGDKKQERLISHEWQTCLQLKEKQTHQFSFQQRLEDESILFFISTPSA
jgi:hypothetical protein